MITDPREVAFIRRELCLSHPNLRTRSNGTDAWRSTEGVGLSGARMLFVTPQMAHVAEAAAVKMDADTRAWGLSLVGPDPMIAVVTANGATLRLLLMPKGGELYVGSILDTVDGFAAWRQARANGERVTDTFAPAGAFSVVKLVGASVFGEMLDPLAAALILADQPLALSDTVTPSRQFVKAERRAGRPQPDVRVISLRRESRSVSGEYAPVKRRDRDHRWLVSGHWRRQPVGEGRSEIRPTWVTPHVKGPTDKPIRVTEKVYALRR